MPHSTVSVRLTEAMIENGMIVVFTERRTSGTSGSLAARDTTIAISLDVGDVERERACDHGDDQPRDACDQRRSAATATPPPPR